MNPLDLPTPQVLNAQPRARASLTAGQETGTWLHAADQSDMSMSTRGDRLNAVLRYVAPDAGLKSVLFVIDNFNGAKDHCWPSMGTIASCASMAESTCREALSRLVNEGVVVVQNRKRPDGSQTSNSYRINYDLLILKSGGAPPNPGAPPHRTPVPPPPNPGALDPLRGSAQKDPPTYPHGFWDRNASVALIASAFPSSNGSNAPGKIRQAIYNLGGSSVDPRFTTEQEASAWLLGRVKAWGASRLCQTTPQAYRPSMARWIEDGKYDCADSEWEHPYQNPAQTDNQNIIHKPSADIAREVAERMARAKAEKEAWNRKVKP